jgi:hypothetical protein
MDGGLEVNAVTRLKMSLMTPLMMPRKIQIWVAEMHSP